MSQINRNHIPAITNFSVNRLHIKFKIEIKVWWNFLNNDLVTTETMIMITIIKSIYISDIRSSSAAP